jgi:DNA-binding beta-propeller fold protein YncE
VTSSTTGPACGPPPASVLCTAVTWSLTPNVAASGSINASTGIYTAPATAPTTPVTVVAASVLDITETASATISVVAATDPALTSINPATGAIGAPFEDVTLTGTNFISTTNIFINHFQLPSQSILTELNGTTLRVRIPDSFLALLPTPPATTTTLVFTAARQGGAQQLCSPDPTTCQLLLSPTRPAVVGTTPDSIPQGSSGALAFTINGGFFGTPTTPLVTTTFAGEVKFPQIGTDDRQLSVTVSGADVTVPGLFPVAVFSNVLGNAPGAPRAVANLAVQPVYPTPPSLTATLSVGTTPCGLTLPLPPCNSPVAIAMDTAKGLAVVANQGTNDVTLIDLTQPTPVIRGYICTATVGAALTVTESGACPPSGPTGVAVDNLRHIALVANATTNTAAVIDLQGKTVTSLINSLLNGAISPATPFVPAAVGINPLTGLALLVYSSTNNASIIDLTQSPPAIVGTVGISTGPTPRVSVSPSLNWALVSPGGAGTLSIVDLGQRNVNTILPVSASGATRTAGTVTITTSSAHTLQVNESVLIQGVADPSFNGVFTVASVPTSTTFTYSQPATLANAASGGGTISYSAPIATLGVNPSLTGVALNDETRKAILVDPFGASSGFVFNVLDQSSNVISFPSTVPGVGNVGAAVNPLGNLGVVVNENNKLAVVVDPAAAAVLAVIPVGTKPVDVAIDPATNLAVVVNQGDNSVSIFPLGALRTPQILQASVSPGPSFPGLAVLVPSSQTTLASPVNQTLTIVGTGLANATARLDGTPLTPVSVSDRVMTVTVPAAMQASPRRYTLDVRDNGTLAVSNAESFAVIQSVDLTSTSCPAPAPQGVAIDPQHNVAVVTEPGCTPGLAAIINLPAGAGPVGTGPTVAVGTSPTGVGILSQAGLAVVANQGSNNASIIDVVNGVVTNTVSTDAGPSGVAIDSGTGNALVTATNSNTLDVFSVQSPPASPTSIGVQQGPVAVAVDPTRELALVANGTSNNASVVSLGSSGVISTISGLFFPTGVVFDPISSNFLVTSSLQNQVLVVNVNTQSSSGIRVGINPTSLAYNAATATLVTTNSLSQTMTVVDFLDRTVRAVFPITPGSMYAVDIHPVTNLAVVADAAHNRVLLLPLPR